MNNAEVARVKGWERFRWLCAGFSARRGGVSAAFGGNALNLGWKADDTDASVGTNRRLFVTALCGDRSGEQSLALVTLRQVHGDRIHVVRTDGTPLATGNGRAVLEGDGMVTDTPGLLLGIQVADCVPVLLADTRRRGVAALHAGWRGTLAGIVEKAVDRMGAEFGSRPEDMVAAIGPSIGPCCYAVGEEVRSGFGERYAYAAELLRAQPGGALHLDLWEANRRQLLESGIPAAQITVLGECTACAQAEDGTRRYFSHRADNGVTGRMMGGIAVCEESSR